MAAKLLQSLADDNPDLQKQIGCMTSIFQMFDRHQMIVSGLHRRTLPRHSQISNGSPDEELIRAYQRQPAENKNVSERQRLSTESSRASFSSSRSSSFSSVDYSRGTQHDPASVERTNFLEASFDDSLCRISPRLARQSAGFPDIVKESMIREARGSLSKTRDLRPSKTVEGISTSRNRNVTDGQRREPDYHYKSSEASRVFYDEIETCCVDSRHNLLGLKSRDLPRLSLDSRECLMRQGDADSLSKSQFKASLKRSCSVNDNGQNLKEELGTQRGRPPSLVAKLMGLTALPDATSASGKDKVLMTVPAKIIPKKPTSDSTSPIFKKEPPSPRRMTLEMKPLSSSRIPVEPAPWKKQSTRHVSSPAGYPLPSVYSEIEKRFKDIEFDQSGKDLRALKQILDSIHSKGLLEKEMVKENQKSVSAAQYDAMGEPPRHENSSRRLDLPIVIMKPISRPPRRQAGTNICKDHAVISNEKYRSVQHSTRAQQQPKDTTGSSQRNVESISSKTRLKKLDLEKQIQAQGHPTDANGNGGKVSKRLTQSVSFGGKVQMKSHENEASCLFGRNTTEDSKIVRSSKVNGSNSPSKRPSKQLSDQPSLPVRLNEGAPEYPSPVSVLNTSAYMDDSMTEEKQLKTLPGDLAESFCSNKSSQSSALTSGISRKKLLSIDSLVQKLKRLNSTHDESKTDYIALLSDDASPDHRYISEILVASGLLLREFSSNAKKPFELHPSGNLINPELFNVLEQTKSGTRLTEDINVNAEESKCHRKLIFDAINEILTKKLAVNGILPDYTVKNRKLARKAPSTQNLMKELCGYMDQFQPRKKRECKLDDEDENDGGDAALRKLLWEDVMQRSDCWSTMQGRISEVVLDIERWLFKDLVNEIVSGDAVNYRSRPKSGSPGYRLLK